MSISVMPLTRGVGFGGGWLSMAPQTDDGPSSVVPQQPVGVLAVKHDSTNASPSAPASAHASPVVPPPRPVATSTTYGVSQAIASGSGSTDQGKAHHTTTSGQAAAQRAAMVNRNPIVPLARQIVPRTNARFSVGADSVSQPATPLSITPPSPPLSGGDGDDSPPPFDVRNSFAPMRWGEPGPTISSRRASEAQDGKAGNRLVQGSGSTANGPDASSTARKGHDTMEAQAAGENGENDQEEEDDGERVVYAGRKWKGKTAHAIELEMEALGDRTVMSYAPDAVYLASRLEGLRRNLEAGGDRFRRRMWEDIEEEEQVAAAEAEAAASVVQADIMDEDEKEPIVERSSPVLLPEQDAIVSSTKSLKQSPFQSSSRLASGFLSPVQEVPNNAPTQQDLEQSIERAIVAPDMETTTTLTIDPAAKEAALDARVEIRTLRRPDLEQIRELHCYHGSGDKVDTETYTTSAAFLLRLLVDEHYVCLVAVAKPLPEPPALPTGLAPRPPPPSLDMPASKSPFLLAGRHPSAAHLQRLGDRRYSSGLQSSPLGPTRAAGGIPETPAPRSFGIGPASSENNSSAVDTSDEEEQMRQESMFERAKVASTYVTGDTSPPVLEDQSMPDIAEEGTRDAADDVAVSETEINGADHHAQRFSGTTSRRKSSSVASRNSVLAGPTFDVAPPRAIRVMGAPPLGGIPPESETILGVASARIKVVQRTVDDFASQAHEWVLGSAPSPAANGGRDASWPGLDPKGERSMVTREAHIMTLSVLPGERGQGLGARLLDRLMDECKRRTAGPRIHLASGSNTTEEGFPAPPRAHQDAPMRTVLEMHPSNAAAMQLYRARDFRQVAGNKGTIKHFFRGDQRIPSSIRLKAGGSDAVRMEHIDLPTK